MTRKLLLAGVPAAVLMVALLPKVLVAAQPRLQQIAPQGGQRGTEVTVVFSGQRIGQKPQEILWHDPGIETLELKRLEGNRVEARLAIPEASRPGIHGLRIRTQSGISNLMTFHVGTLPEVAEAEPNSSREQAQEIGFGSVVNGVIQNEDVDYFAFTAKQGERISVEVEGLRLGRTFFDPVLLLYDPSGNLVASSDDLHVAKQDAGLSCIAPSEGRYVVELRETAYRGNNESTYRLHVGGFPRPAMVFPPGGRAGEEVEVRWIGGEATGGTAKVTLPEAAGSTFEYFPEDDRGTAPSPHPLRVVDLPVAIESEGNDNRNKATPMEVPGVATGIIEKPEDRDHFKFTAKKGQVFYVRMHARSLGSPLDSIMRVQRAKGGSVGGNDDDQGKPDSYIRFQAPEDDDYVLQIEDHLKRGGEDFVYWVEITSPSPHVELELEEQRRYEATVFEVPRGNRSAAMVRVSRRDMGGDELAIDWRDLPPGVSVEAHPVAGNYDQMPVLLHAEAEAPLGQALPTLVARRTDGDAGLPTKFTSRTWMVRGQNNRDMWNYLGHRPVVVVTETAPFEIEIVEPKSPLVQRGTKNLRVVAKRKEGFDEAILVRMLYNPPGVSSNASLRIKQGETEAEIPITANPNARVGDWKIIVRGEANARGQLVAATPFATLKVVAPYLAMTLPATTMEQGTSTSMKVAVEQLVPFAGEARVELKGLPPGVTTEPVTITSESTEFDFQIVAAADARPGQHRGLFCQVTLTIEGEEVQHSVGGGELRVDQPLPPANAPPTAQR